MRSRAARVEQGMWVLVVSFRDRPALTPVAPSSGAPSNPNMATCNRHSEYTASRSIGS